MQVPALAGALVTTLVCGSAIVLSEAADEANFAKGRLVLARFPSPKSAFAVVKRLERDNRIDVLTKSAGTVRRTALLRVGARNLHGVLSALSAVRVQARVFDNDTEAMAVRRLKEIGPYPDPRDATRRPISLTNFESYEQIAASLDYYAWSAAVNGSIRRFVIGQSYEGRDIVGIRIGNSAAKKRIVLIECGIHAREWASHTSCLYMIHHLATRPDDYSNLLDRYEFHILPVANPDGYVYTWKVDPWWRHNRRPTHRSQNPSCVGVDLNRNFVAGPPCSGPDLNPCSPVYCGPAPFSEPESRAIRAYVMSVKDDAEYYVSLHAYGRMWMFPYGYTYRRAPNYAALMRKTKEAVSTLRETFDHIYRYGPIINTIYEVTGCSIDWAYTTAGIPYSFAIELPEAKRDNKRASFFIDRSEIIPFGKEILTGLEVLWTA